MDAFEILDIVYSIGDLLNLMLLCMYQLGVSVHTPHMHIYSYTQ